MSAEQEISSVCDSEGSKCSTSNMQCTELMSDADDDDVFISQAYDTFLRQTEVKIITDIPSNAQNENNVQCSTGLELKTNELSDSPSSTDLITIDDLLGHDYETCSNYGYHVQTSLTVPDYTIEEPDTTETTAEYITLSTADAAQVQESLTMPDVAIEESDFNKQSADQKMFEEADLKESSIVSTIILMEIFDKVFKKVKPLSRWKKNQPENWKKNIAKKRRCDGLAYETKSKCRTPKKPKVIDCTRCQYKCTQKINDSDREKLCRYYWKLDYVGKKNFILSQVTVKKTQRVLVVNRKRPRVRSYSKTCHFNLEGEQIKVCQKFFCSTLCIGGGVLQDAIQKRNDIGQFNLDKDPRGCHEPANKITESQLKEIVDHIESFPTMESHYTRKDSKRQYLAKDLSISKMYNLYSEICEKKNCEPVSETTYRRIFGTNFNLGFFLPKKDQCLICSKYERALKSNEQTKDLENEYQEHVKRKQACNAEKAKDKDKAESKDNFHSVTFDLQAILQLPSCDIGLLYYTRKLTVYNLTIYESALPNEAFCFTWTEMNGKKGSCEIGTILYHYLSECIPRHITEVSLFSDTCGGQNRNQFIAAILLWAVQKIDHIEVLEQKFLESGHTYMEADSMHSSIETEKANTSIYTISEWMNVFKRARSKKIYRHGKQKVKKNSYHVKEFKFNDFKDLKRLAQEMISNRTKTRDGQQVKWLKIKRIRYVKGKPNTIFFNYDMSNEFLCIDVNPSDPNKQEVPRDLNAVSINTHQYGTRSARKRKMNEIEPIEDSHQASSEPTTECDNTVTLPTLHQLYDAPIPISTAKKRDLMNLCKKGVIPEEYHAWYGSLKTDNCKKDLLPDATLSDPDETSDLDSNEE